jgi:AraC-like DNA-binding protein
LLKEKGAVMIITKDNLELNSEYPFGISEQVLKKADNCEDSFHWHSFFEITYIYKGCGNYYVNGQKYEVEQGNIIIFNNVEPHGWSVCDEDMHALVMVFSSDFVAERTSLFDLDYLRPFIERGSNFRNKIEKEDTISKEISEIINEIHKEWNIRSVGYKLMIKANVLRILTLLSRYSQDETKSDRQLQKKKLEMKRLQDAFDYIALHYCDKITLNEVAESVHMSPNYFSSYFGRVTNISFSEYLVKLRLQKANKLMKNSTLSSAEIAARCGFNNMSNFYRLFKKQTGSSPRNKKKDTEGME